MRSASKHTKAAMHDRVVVAAPIRRRTAYRTENPRPRPVPVAIADVAKNAATNGPNRKPTANAPKADKPRDARVFVRASIWCADRREEAVATQKSTTRAPLPISRPSDATPRQRRASPDRGGRVHHAPGVPALHARRGVRYMDRTARNELARDGGEPRIAEARRKSWRRKAAE